MSAASITDRSRFTPTNEWLVFIDEPDIFEATEIELERAFRLGRLTCIREETVDHIRSWYRVSPLDAPRFTREGALELAGKYALLVAENQWAQERDRVYVIKHDGTELQRVIAEADSHRLA